MKSLNKVVTLSAADEMRLPRLLIDGRCFCSIQETHFSSGYYTLVSKEVFESNTEIQIPFSNNKDSTFWFKHHPKIPRVAMLHLSDRIEEKCRCCSGQPSMLEIDISTSCYRHQFLCYRCYRIEKLRLSMKSDK